MEAGQEEVQEEEVKGRSSRKRCESGLCVICPQAMGRRSLGWWAEKRYCKWWAVLQVRAHTVCVRLC